MSAHRLLGKYITPKRAQKAVEIGYLLDIKGILTQLFKYSVVCTYLARISRQPFMVGAKCGLKDYFGCVYMDRTSQECLRPALFFCGVKVMIVVNLLRRIPDDTGMQFFKNHSGRIIDVLLRHKSKTLFQFGKRYAIIARIQVGFIP